MLQAMKAALETDTTQYIPTPVQSGIKLPFRARPKVHPSPSTLNPKP
jgi:hypothetical protein